MERIFYVKIEDGGGNECWGGTGRQDELRDVRVKKQKRKQKKRSVCVCVFFEKRSDEI